MKAIKDAKLQASDKYVKDDAIRDIVSKYDAESPRQAYERMNARLSLLDKYNAEKKELEKQIKETLKKDPVLGSLEGRMEKFKANVKEGKEFAAAETKMQSRWAKKLGFGKEKSKTVEGMTEEQAKKALEGSQVEKDFKAAQEKLDKYAKDHKIEAKELTGDELAKALNDKGIAATKEEHVKSIKEQAAKEVEPLLKNLKKVHIGYTAAAAAGILGIAGLIAGLSGNKNDVA